MPLKSFPEVFLWGETGVGPRRKAGANEGERGGVARFASTRRRVASNVI
jgi:hypothetical protein